MTKTMLVSVHFAVEVQLPDYHAAYYTDKDYAIETAIQRVTEGDALMIAAEVIDVMED